MRMYWSLTPRKIQGLKERIEVLKQNVEHYDQAHASAKSGLQDVGAALSALQSSLAASLNKAKEHEQVIPPSSASEAARGSEGLAPLKRSYDESQNAQGVSNADPVTEPKRSKGAAAVDSSSTAP